MITLGTIGRTGGETVTVIPTGTEAHDLQLLTVQKAFKLLD
jgi:hypothetical protein